MRIKPLNVFTSQQVVQERVAVCKFCEHRALSMCTRCGCFIPAKVRFAGSNCPEGLWSEAQALEQEVAEPFPVFKDLED